MNGIRERLRGPGLHRASDEVERLREVNDRLVAQLAAAKTSVIGLERALAKTRAHQAEAEQVVVCLAADLDDAAQELEQRNADVTALRRQLAPYLAAEANAGAITVPEMVRDISAIEDQVTAPIDVRPLWAALGNVVATPGSADPAAPPA